MLPNPKRRANGRTQELYDYYAGYSPEFVRAALEHAQQEQGSVIADPWNGAGTTTRIAAERGYCPKGYDLNPVMVIVAKAALLTPTVRPSTLPLARDILKKAKALTKTEDYSEPLLRWFATSTATRIRGIELAIQELLVPVCNRGQVSRQSTLEGISSLAAFYYTALFRITRNLTRSFRSSNPTWISQAERPLMIPGAILDRLFSREIISMETALGTIPAAERCEATIGLANSCALPLSDESVDVVLSSPPYCTRIDYAIATLPELAVLNFSDNEIRKLRESLIGSPTVGGEAVRPDPNWGQTCEAFLAAVQRHPSKGSQGYYMPVFRRYFREIYASLAEIRRITRVDGHVFLVVQDSSYKEIHNDVPTVVQEMAASFGFELIARSDFMMANPIRNINSRSRAYRSTTATTESVLHLRAPGPGIGEGLCK